MLFCRRDLFQEKWNSAAFALRHSEKCLLSECLFCIVGKAPIASRACPALFLYRNVCLKNKAALPLIGNFDPVARTPQRVH